MEECIGEKEGELKHNDSQFVIDDDTKLPRSRG
jgi:hypothetical protein